MEDKYSMEAGKLSVTTVLRAESGPLLTTVIVYIIVPPTLTFVLLTVLLIINSDAGGICSVISDASFEVLLSNSFWEDLEARLVGIGCGYLSQYV
jgi:hypothetical protein